MEESNCPNCGAGNDSDAAFCGDCGASLQIADSPFAQPPGRAKPKVAPALSAEAMKNVAIAPSVPSTPFAVSQPRSGQSGIVLKLLVGGCVALGMLLALGVTLFALVRFGIPISTASGPNDFQKPEVPTQKSIPPLVKSPGPTLPPVDDTKPGITIVDNPPPVPTLEVKIPLAPDSLITRLAQQVVGDFRLKQAEALESRKAQGASDAVQLHYLSPEGAAIEMVLTSWPTAQQAIQTMESEVGQRRSNGGAWRVEQQENSEQDGKIESNLTILQNGDGGREEVHFRKERIYFLIHGPKETAVNFFNDLTFYLLAPVPGT